MLKFNQIICHHCIPINCHKSCHAHITMIKANRHVRVLIFCTSHSFYLSLDHIYYRGSGVRVRTTIDDSMLLRRLPAMPRNHFPSTTGSLSPPMIVGSGGASVSRCLSVAGGEIRAVWIIICGPRAAHIVQVWADPAIMLQLQADLLRN
jgi:hypothetical protein